MRDTSWDEAYRDYIIGLLRNNMEKMSKQAVLVLKKLSEASTMEISHILFSHDVLYAIYNGVLNMDETETVDFFEEVYEETIIPQMELAIWVNAANRLGRQDVVEELTKISVQGL